MTTLTLPATDTLPAPCGPAVAGGCGERVVVAVIVLFLVRTRREDQTHRPGRKVVDLAPHHRADVEPVVGPIQLIPVLLTAVVQDYIEAAAHRDDELLQLLVR